jgi:hypothetical protein
MVAAGSGRHAKGKAMRHTSSAPPGRPRTTPLRLAIEDFPVGRTHHRYGRALPSAQVTPGRSRSRRANPETSATWFNHAGANCRVNLRTSTHVCHWAIGCCHQSGWKCPFPRYLSRKTDPLPGSAGTMRPGSVVFVIEDLWPRPACLGATGLCGRRNVLAA